MALPAPNIVTFEAPSSSTAPKNLIAELKNGKVIFKQKPVSFEKASETMQEIVKFRDMLNSRVQNQDKPLINIPDEHKPLIVKLAQESDKAAVPLAKQIRSILLPGLGEVEDAHRLSLESILPLSIVEHAIKAVMTRINYGLDAPLGQKLPSALCVWRWEVQDTYRDCLPKSARDNADARLMERVQASTDLRAAFESLSQAERDVILDPKSVVKLPTKDTGKSETVTISAANQEHFSMDFTANDHFSIADSEVHAENLVPKGRAKRVSDLEKAAKIKEKEERRAARAEKEKKQKEDAERSRSIMANFFGKVKPSAQDSPTKDSNISANPSVEDDFQRTFRPFTLKKDAELAPYNWFLDEKRGSRCRMSGTTHEEAIVIDDDTPVQSVPGSAPPARGSAATSSDSPTCLLKVIEELRRNSLSLCLRTRKSSSLKTYNPHSVRDTVLQLNDAEIAGDPTQVRHLLSVLRDRQLFPAKVLIFHDDSRPGYYGTWTRNSRVVGPRTPLGRDILAHDYGYDSGEEWEDESPGDADDVADDGEDDEQDAEDADSDLDSWLVDDDDEIRTPLSVDDLSPPPTDLLIPPLKRKAENVGKRSEKKRKAVVQLTPYVKGPFWESPVGQCQHQPFNAYCIQLLNDTPDPIDPFTFVSTAFEKGQNSEARPPLPGTTQYVASSSKRVVGSVPKTPFPEAQLGALLAKISDLKAPNLNYLIDSIYQEFRNFNIKRNAIEAKVREVTEKSKDKKIWVVKQEVHTLLSCDSVDSLR